MEKRYRERPRRQARRRRHEKRQDRDGQESKTPPLWFGAIFVLAGGFIAAIGAGWIEVEPSSVHAPGWVIQLTGFVFMLGGAMCYAHVLGERVQNGLAVLMMVAFAAVFSWVAFGPGERQFSGGVSVGPLSANGRPGEWGGRIAFGFGSVMLWAIALAIAARWVRSFSD